MTPDLDITAILAAANDLHLRVRALLLEARKACRDTALVIARQEREERDEAAIEASTTITGRI